MNAGNLLVRRTRGTAERSGAAHVGMVRSAVCLVGLSLLFGMWAYMAPAAEARTYVPDAQNGGWTKLAYKPRTFHITTVGLQDTTSMTLSSLHWKSWGDARARAVSAHWRVCAGIYGCESQTVRVVLSLRRRVACGDQTPRDIYDRATVYEPGRRPQVFSPLMIC